MPAGSYRQFAYPLNVLVQILLLEEGRVDALHYGLFEDTAEEIGTAQARSTTLLLSRLPPPPARVLDVGCGLGTTLHELMLRGYAAEGVTPEPSQLALAAERYRDGLSIHCVTFEALTPPPVPFDVVMFQESSQYIDAAALFVTARTMTERVLVLDEFAVRPAVPAGPLHSLARFLDAAAAAGFAPVENLDLSTQAAPTIDYFLARLPRHRERLQEELGISGAHVDTLIDSGQQYRDRYRAGSYGYHLIDLRWTS
jgi:SAM-dependent methyltransferase